MSTIKTIKLEMLASPNERLSEDCNVVARVDTSTHKVTHIDYVDKDTRSFVASWGVVGTADFWLEETKGVLEGEHTDTETGEVWHEYEEYLIRTWLDMRSSPWQWFSSNLINGKMIVGDLNIDKKARIWTLDLREYSSSAEFLAILGSSGSDKSDHRK